MHLKSDRWWDWKLSSVYINIRLFQGIPTSRNFELDPLLVNNCNALCTDPLDVGVIAFLRIRVSESINFLVSFFILFFAMKMLFRCWFQCGVDWSKRNCWVRDTKRQGETERGGTHRESEQESERGRTTEIEKGGWRQDVHVKRGWVSNKT